ncbi:hypothetical protein ACQY0O_001301 [Thecaphora frezii]
MSFRFHKGPALVTLFHDKSSPASRAIFNLLSSQHAHRDAPSSDAPPASPASPAPPSSSSSSSSSVSQNNSGDASGSEAGAGAGGGGGGWGSAYLRQAATDPSSAPFEFEVVDRSVQPPTPDQMRSILQYLERSPAPTSHAAQVAADTSTATNEAQRRRQILQTRLNQSKSDTQAQTQTQTTNTSSQISNGPLVVHWDEGFATNSLQGVQAMLERIQQQQQQRSATTANSTSNRPGGSCIVM